ncbi:MAG: CPBP family intramembrane metalloprotease [Gemmatimonadales bacterium]|nr:CPBP family intramembrane metalloprotease [Gemmatimonadales bacterium]
MLRSYSPTLAAFAAVLLAGGGLASALGDRLRRWPTWRRDSAVIVGATVLVSVISVGAGAIAIGEWPATKVSSIGRLVLGPLLIAVLDGPLGEEIGWRGLLLPLLLQRCTAIRASLLVGVVWFAWHLPLYAVDGRTLDAAFLLPYLIAVLAYSLIFTWLVRRAGGSIWVAVAAHTAINYSQFALSTLFPSLGATQADRWAFIVAMVVLGSGAAFALRGGTDGALSLPQDNGR